MVRMGHDSERAAMIYLHSSRERQRALADAVGKAAGSELAAQAAQSVQAIGHAAGTESPCGLWEWCLTCAPTATRTRDPGLEWAFHKTLTAHLSPINRFTCIKVSISIWN